MTLLRAPGLVLRVDDDGHGTVTSSARPELRWLTAVGPLEVVTADGPLGLGSATVTGDTDEIEVERSGDGLRTLVRHGVDAAWDVRVVLTNESTAELVLPQVRLGWRAGPGCVVVALAAGAAAVYAVQTVDGDGPVLVGRLRSGAQAGVDVEALVLGPLTLPVGHRWSVSWRLEVVPDAGHAVTPGLPSTTWLDLDQTVVLPAGPDVAVVAPDLVVETGDDAVEVGAIEPGTRPVEVRGPRGTTTYALTWAPDLDDLVDDVVGLLLGGRRTPAGTVRLPDAAAGLAVQDALARRSAGSPDALAEALDVLGGSLLETLEGPDDAGTAPSADPFDASDPFVLAFLGREADRTGDATFLAAASRALLGVSRPSRGTGIAGVALALSLVRTERSAAAVVGQLATLSAASGDALAHLELSLLLRGRDDPADAAVRGGLRRLGAALGAGLPGRVLPDPPVELVAYAATLLGLVDESTGEGLRDVWGVSAAEVARQAAAQARARADASASAWLVLGRPPR